MTKTKIDTYFIGDKETCGYCNKGIYFDTPVSVDGIEVYHRYCSIRLQKLLKMCEV